MRKANGSWKMMVLVFSMLLVFSACGSGGKSTGNTATPAAEATPASEATATAEETKAPAEELKPAELIWYYPGPNVPADLQTVEDAINKITQAKINATIKLKPVGFGDYNQKMNTVVASGEKADIIWTSSWLFNYGQNQGKGAFIALDDLIEKYAPALKSTLPPFVLNASKIHGKLYGIPNYQALAARETFIVQKRFVDKYKLDVNSIKTLEDIEPFLEQIKAGEPDIIPIGMASYGYFGDMHTALGYDIVNSALAVSYDAPDKIFNVFDSPYYARYTELVRNWYTKGYINENAAMTKASLDILKTGKVAVYYHGSSTGAETAYKNDNGGHDVVLIPITPFFVAADGPIATMQAISRSSENPERAMMFINLLNTDKDLFNTISYGIEGKHYTKVSDNIVKVNKDAGYVPNTGWVFGNVFNGYLVEGQDPGVFEQQKKDTENAVSSPIMGFIFDPTAVSAEIANITTVIDQYTPALNTGTVDPASEMAEFLNKLKSAGIEKVVAEAQKQLDAFNSAG